MRRLHVSICLVPLGCLVLLGGCGRTSLFTGLPNEGIDPPPDGSIDPDAQGPVPYKDCVDGTDDDGDGEIDCDDLDCAGVDECFVPGVEICSNGLDDDQDGATDCDDPDCAKNLMLCTPGDEDCDNEVDDDDDGATDCLDPDCTEFAGCATLGCEPDLDLGVLDPVGDSVSGTLVTSGASDDFASGCGPLGGGDGVMQVELTEIADVAVTVDQTGDHVVAIFAAGIGQECDGNPLTCFDPEGQPHSSTTLFAVPAGVYYILVDAYVAGLEGEVTIELTTGAIDIPEECSNGDDDDGDGAVDCNDLDCQEEPLCLPQLCVEDVNLGVLVVDGDSASTMVNTVDGGNDQELMNCTNGGGGDRVIRFVLLEVANVLVIYTLEGEQAFGLYSSDPAEPATPCEDLDGRCSNYASGSSEIWLIGLPAGEYFFVIDAVAPGSEGLVSLTLEASDEGDVELCADGLDNDEDGAIDCEDLDCDGVAGCSGPEVCIPDETLTPPWSDFGSDLDVTTVSTVGAGDDQVTECAFGGGEDYVIGFELDAAANISAVVEEGDGSHVLDLYGSDGRGFCDDPEQQMSCVDLDLVPWPSWYWPNIQAGSYYLIVEAFEAGTEGSVTLGLGFSPAYALEDCSNKIDDDDDSFIDCADSNCATADGCEGVICDPDDELGYFELGDSAFSAFETDEDEDDVALTCAPDGGREGVVSFTLLEDADVIVDYAQTGSHSLALAGDMGVACDSNVLACEATEAASSGSVTFEAVEAGAYFIIAEADSATEEGAVLLTVSAE